MEREIITLKNQFCVINISVKEYFSFNIPKTITMTSYLIHRVTMSKIL